MRPHIHPACHHDDCRRHCHCLMPHAAMCFWCTLARIEQRGGDAVRMVRMRLCRAGVRA